MAEAEVLDQMVLCLPMAECMLLCPALAHQQPRGAAVFSFAADAHVLRLWSLPESKTHVSHRPLVPQKHLFSKGPLLRILSANECDAQRFQVSSP